MIPVQRNTEVNLLINEVENGEVKHAVDEYDDLFILKFGEMNDSFHHHYEPVVNVHPYAVHNKGPNQVHIFHRLIYGPLHVYLEDHWYAHKYLLKHESTNDNLSLLLNSQDLNQNLLGRFELGINLNLYIHDREAEQKIHAILQAINQLLQEYGPDEALAKVSFAIEFSIKEYGLHGVLDEHEERIDNQDDDHDLLRPALHFLHVVPVQAHF